MEVIKRNIINTLNGFTTILEEGVPGLEYIDSITLKRNQMTFLNPAEITRLCVLNVMSSCSSSDMQYRVSQLCFKVARPISHYIYW